MARPARVVYSSQTYLRAVPGRGETWAASARKNASWLIAFGVLQVLAGIASIAIPSVAGAAATIIIGALLTVAGIIGVTHALYAGSFGQGLWGMLSSILAIVFGGIMLFQPFVALISLTLVLGIYFCLGGISALALAIRMRKSRGWEWMLVNGLVTLVLALLILSDWPFSSFWAIGTLVGVDIILTGMASVMLGSAARQGFFR